jgi:hypothetical protein
MLKSIQSSLVVLSILAIFLSGCAGNNTPADASTVPSAKLGTQPAIVNLGTSSQNVCATQETKKPEIERIARMMGEFDDTSFLVQAIKNPDQLVQVILVLQRVRRDAVNSNPPECLIPLRDAQVNFMSGVVLTTVSIMSRAKADVIQRQLGETRKLREIFDKELATQLGLKYVTATPAPTIPATAIPPTSTVTPVTATTEQDIYVVQGAGLNFPAVGTFLKGQVTNVIGRNEQGDWIAIDVPSNPGNAGWVPKQLIKLNGAEGSIPIITPPPSPQPTITQ